MIPRIQSKIDMKRLFFWLSSAGTEVLLQCPVWEQRRYVAIGALVLIPTMFAFIAAFFTVSTVVAQPLITCVLASFWAFVILSIDRALLAAYRSYASLTSRLCQLALRLCISVIMGIAVSHPAVLSIFSEAVQVRINEDKNAEIQQHRKQANARKQDLYEKIDALRKSASFPAMENTSLSAAIDKENQGQLPVNSPQDPQLEKILSPIRLEAEKDLAALSEQKTGLETEKQQYMKSAEEYRQMAEDEESGKRGAPSGQGTRYKRINDEFYKPKLVKIKELEKSIDEINNQINQRNKELQNAQKEQIRQFEERRKKEHESILADLVRRTETQKLIAEKTAEERARAQELKIRWESDQLQVMKEQIETYQKDIRKIDTDEAQQIAQINTVDRKDILSLSLALHKILNDRDNGGQFATYVYYVLLVTFTLVDASAILLKFLMKPGPYDTLVDRDEYRFEEDRTQYKELYGQRAREFMHKEIDALAPKKIPVQQSLRTLS